MGAVGFNAGGFLLITGVREGSWERWTFAIEAIMSLFGNQLLSVSSIYVKSNNRKNVHCREETHFKLAQGERGLLVTIEKSRGMAALFLSVSWLFCSVMASFSG